LLFQTLRGRESLAPTIHTQQQNPKHNAGLILGEERDVITPKYVRPLMTGELSIVLSLIIVGGEKKRNLPNGNVYVHEYDMGGFLLKGMFSVLYL